MDSTVFDNSTGWDNDGNGRKYSAGAEDGREDDGLIVSIATATDPCE